MATTPRLDRTEAPTPRSAPPPPSGRQQHVQKLHLLVEITGSRDQTKNIQVLNDSCSPLSSKLSFMFSEYSSYNLGCFSVLVTSPKETYDPGVTWNREEISEKGASEDRTLQGAAGAEAACSPPACLCGKSGNGLRVPGHGSP